MKNQHPHSNSNSARLVNGFWVIAAVVAVCLVTISQVSSSWPRLSTQLVEPVSLPAYAGSIGLSYLSWIGIAVFINYFRRHVPMFSHSRPYWWMIHGAVCILVGLVHLVLDTTLLWLAFSQGFTFRVAFFEKILQWLPYEILGYWACLGILTACDRQQALFENKSSRASYLQRLAVNVAGETVFVDVIDIDWIESYDNYVLIWKGDKSYMLKDTMNHLESVLDPALFQRVHRSAIVNLGQVKKMEDSNSAIRLKNGKRLTISRRRRAAVTQVLKEKA